MNINAIEKQFHCVHCGKKLFSHKQLLNYVETTGSNVYFSYVFRKYDAFVRKQALVWELLSNMTKQHNPSLTVYIMFIYLKWT